MHVNVGHKFEFALHFPPGLETFQGRYFHSWEYCSADGMQGKNVIVIGIGNSGGDIAVDVSRVAKQVGANGSASYT